jgi:rare lipoprotein A (peptidoglycan hydrolase)
MRFNVRTVTVMLALLAMPALCAQAALASSGGASAPSESSSGTPSTAHTTTVRPTGIATWFGPGFYGHKTACGQTLTPAVEGVANRTLPCGTLVKVGYGAKTMTLPVLDRGPYSHIGASWDLTAGAARALGISETVRIKTRVVGATANVPTLGLPPVSQTTVLAGGSEAG